MRRTAERQSQNFDKMQSAGVPKTQFSVVSAQAVPIAPILGGPNGPQRFDILPDGRMVGALRAESSQADTAPSQIRVVLNWFEELKRRVPAR